MGWRPRSARPGSTDRSGSPSRNHQGTPFSIGRISVSGEIIGLANRAASASAGALTAITRRCCGPGSRDRSRPGTSSPEKHYSRGWRVRAVAPPASALALERKRVSGLREACRHPAADRPRANDADVHQAAMASLSAIGQTPRSLSPSFMTKD